MTEQSKPADKVWAMYDGRFAPYYVEAGRWYPVRDCGDTFHFLPTVNEDDRQKWDINWKRHVGPTPPDVSPVQIDDWFYHDWCYHDGSPNRPKGVGKRDRLEAHLQGGANPVIGFTWKQLKGNIVTRYRRIERAPKKEKRRKVWMVHDNGLGVSYDEEYLARQRRDESGGTLYTAKPTPVKDEK